MRRFLSLVVIFLMLSCSTETALPEEDCFTYGNPPRSAEKVSIEQGVWGDIWFWKGNFMPDSRGQICRVKRAVYIYELTTTEEVDRVQYSPFFTGINSDLVTTVTSDEEGFFEVSLEPGTYSLFIMEGEKYYANGYGPEGQIFPVTVSAGNVEEVLINITYEAAF